MYTRLAEPYLVVSHHNTMNLLQKKNNKKTWGKISFKAVKLSSPYCNLPMHTCDTAVRVHGVSQSAKNPNHICTCDTHFGNTAGLPVPVLNPTLVVLFSFCTLLVLVIPAHLHGQYQCFSLCLHLQISNPPFCFVYTPEMALIDILPSIVL